MYCVGEARLCLGYIVAGVQNWEVNIDIIPFKNLFLYKLFNAF